jgi:hypothetical protein
MWGKALYFAVNASYSCPGYCGNKLSDGSYEVFFAEVTIGNCIDTGSNNNNSLKEPPAGYDSVKGHTNGSDVYMVYENSRTYPHFVVNYTL